MNPQYIKIISGRRKAVRDRRIATGIEPDKREIESRQIVEAVVAVSQVDVVRILLEPWILTICRSPQSLALRHIQRLKD